MNDGSFAASSSSHSSSELPTCLLLPIFLRRPLRSFELLTRSPQTLPSRFTTNIFSPLTSFQLPHAFYYDTTYRLPRPPLLVSPCLQSSPPSSPHPPLLPFLFFPSHHQPIPPLQTQNHFTNSPSLTSRPNLHLQNSSPTTPSSLFFPTDYLVENRPHYPCGWGSGVGSQPGSSIGPAVTCEEGVVGTPVPSTYEIWPASAHAFQSASAPA